MELAILVKYRTASATQDISATEYVKKIFQVPFGVPPIRPQQLNEYLSSIVTSAALSAEQTLDLNQVVQPHLAFLAEAQTLNPREIKRFINA